MAENTTWSVTVDSDVAEKFELASKLNKEETNEVICRLMKQYVAESFSRASRSFAPQATIRPNYLVEEDSNYAKANRKIPVWAHKPHQNNHRIIKAYFEIEDEQVIVTVDALADRCSNSTDYPDTFSTDFRGNFAQMKTDARNSHGKVFVVSDGVVLIWSEVKAVMDESKKYFISNSEEDDSLTAITKDKIEAIYSVAKQIYSGTLPRTIGNDKLTKDTGMKKSSVSFYTSAFLYMMEGKEYKRTISLFATRYYLEHIRQDFGKDTLDKALEAVRKHIQYYKSKTGSNLPGQENLIKELAAL